jgi:lysophospholipase
MTLAPLFTDISRAPVDGEAVWQTCADGTRVRVGLWRGGDRGTVLIFPGRTEFIEKYGAVVAEFLARGYSAAVIDWRGQGLSDRPEGKPKLGHVEKFSDYQLDVAALVSAVQEAEFPATKVLLAHSMGGAIGLRAALEGLAVDKLIFSAPMWGIFIEPRLRVPAQLVATVGSRTGFGKIFAPGTGPDNYVEAQEFDGNSLTNDADTYGWLQDQLMKHAELGLGGPSVTWLREGLAEGRYLTAHKPPPQDCLCFIGSQEAIIEGSAVRQIMDNWPNGKLVTIDGAQHEILMEQPHVLKQAWAEIDRFLQ